MTTSASRQTETGSVFPVRPTQVFQRQLSRVAQPFHFRSEPRHDE